MSDDIKKGLLGIVVDETEVSKVMPEINSLTYRGYAAQDLCEYCRFEEVAYLILNKDLPNSIQIKNFEKCIAGMQWHVDKLQIDILYPFQEIYTENLSSNNQSCVVRLTLEETVYLLMGDIEAAAELELFKRYRGDLKADVLIAGHHGAAKSSSFALLKHVKPSVIVFSAGYLNKFGHPAETVLHRAESFGMLILSTEKQGAIAFKSLADADVFTIKFAR